MTHACSSRATSRRADALVLFGATGDLAKRKLFPALYHLERRGELDVPVIGVARSDWTDDDFREHARESILADDPGRRRGGHRATVRPARPRPGRLRRPGDVGDAAPTRSTSTQLEDRRVLHGDPADMFPTVAESLASVGLNERGRIVVEKPFGRDLAVGARAERDAARGLPRGAHLPHRPLPRQGERRGPARVPLLEHAARADLEPQLRAQRAGHDGGDDRRRGPRQLLRRRRRDPRRAAEPPPAGRRAAGDGAAGRARRRASCRTRRPRCSRRCEPIDPKRIVRGQYVGYRDEPGVDPNSTIETFAAARLRDRLVALGRRAVVRPRRQGARPTPPPRPWSSSASRRACCSTRPAGRRRGRNLIRFRLGKHDGVTFTLQAKTPGQHLDSQNVDVAVDFAAALGERQEAYERLLGDAIDGSPRRFAREDVVEQTWRVVQPALDEPGADPPVLPRVVGPVRGRPHPRRRHAGSTRPERRLSVGRCSRRSGADRGADRTQAAASTRRRRGRCRGRVRRRLRSRCTRRR